MLLGFCQGNTEAMSQGHRGIKVLRRGHEHVGPMKRSGQKAQRVQDSQRHLASGSRVRLPDLANDNPRYPLNLNFGMKTSNILFKSVPAQISCGHHHSEIHETVYLKFTFDWAACNLIWRPQLKRKRVGSGCHCLRMEGFAAI